LITTRVMEVSWRLPTTKSTLHEVSGIRHSVVLAYTQVDL
jgi:hypothetical protein